MEAPSSVSLDNDVAVRLGQLLCPFKKGKAPKTEIEIMHRHLMFSPMMRGHLVTASGHMESGCLQTGRTVHHVGIFRSVIAS